MPSKEVHIYVIVCFYIERKCLVYFSSLQVTACLSSYFELRTCRPKTGKLRQLLAECPYRGPEYECEGVMEAEEEEKGTEEEEEGEGMGKEYLYMCLHVLAYISVCVNVHNTIWSCSTVGV